MSTLEQTSRVKDITVAVIALALGIAIYWRDWQAAFSGATFYGPDYYRPYWHALLLALGTCVLLVAITGTKAVVIAVPLLVPSLLLRHVLFLFQVGPTNMWPPALMIDLVLMSLVWLISYGAEHARRAILKSR